MTASQVITTAHALKEWQVAIAALTAGDTILLLRKGGIREEKGRFFVEHEQVWLYPTVEHQKPELLKPAYASQVQVVESGWHPDAIAIPGWATITHTFQVKDAERVAALEPFHIWNERFVTERLHWKPSQPLYVLLLRVYRLAEPIAIPYQAAYGGCRSWIDLEQAFPLQGEAVLTEAEYGDWVAAVQALLQG
ncbi:MAG TPA: DUF1802 family protein [Leptolyngbyaceae cyanobacterium M33_DOE_097]|uniref:DUF1802 family protein n=1 Tax=Oscillatoriales cyanobacterium SpSt-418 TaxID=2282169 RepID=A0A7C3PLK9_9CYAN|nr:DUF1802 family protein [Leptolyngbyaceae cyanobacterium M33_DOE_097]